MSQPISGNSSATPQSGESTPTGAPLLLVESDLFFLVKVRDTLTTGGYAVRVARRMDEIARTLEEPYPALVLVNAAARAIDWRTVVAQARQRGLPVIVYAPHVDTETQAAARDAGATRVIANSKLSADLSGLVARTLRASAGRANAESLDADVTAPDGAAARSTDRNEIAAKTATSAPAPLSQRRGDDTGSPLPPRGGGAGGGG